MVPGVEFGFGGVVQPPAVVPNACSNTLAMTDRDPFVTMNIDGIPREVRHYDSTTVVFLNWDDPRQILFSTDDTPRRIIIDNEYTIECMLNAPDVERTINGKRHK